MGSFNQRARDSSSLERTKIPRRIARFIVGFSFCTPFARFLHTGGKAVFFLALSAFCASWRNLSGQSPSILLRKRELCSAKGMLEFRCKEKTAKQIKSTLPFYSNSTSSCNSNSVELHIANCCFNVPLISCLAIKKVLLLNTLH